MLRRGARMAMLAASLWLIAQPEVVWAQAAAVCPGAADSQDAAEQVLCWAALQARADPRCNGSVCDGAVIAWCKTAALDASAVGHACFLAQVRNRDFAAAMELSEYLQAPTAEVTRCRQALDSVVDMRVVSNPVGASVYVDGAEYGAAPVIVKLKSPWWQRKVSLRFAAKDAGSEVEVSDTQLRAAFDTRACAMGDLVISGPAPAASAASIPAVKPAEPPPPTPSLLGTEPATTVSRKEASGASKAWIWTLVGTVVTGGAAIAFRVVGDGQYADVKSQCAPHCTDAQVNGSGVGVSDGLMVGFAVASGALLVTTVVLAVTGAEDHEKNTAAGMTLRGGLLSGSF